MAFTLNTKEAHIGNAEAAERIARHATALGFTASAHGSGLSASNYVTCELGDRSITIRIANHDQTMNALAAYGEPDYEITADEWMGAVEWLAEIAGRPIPAVIVRSRKAAATRAAKRQAEGDTRMAAYRAEQLARVDAAITQQLPLVRVSKRALVIADSQGEIARKAAGCVSSLFCDSFPCEGRDAAAILQEVRVRMENRK